ncbi:MAG TPA: glucokinase, partial [Xanthomonadales bacterium]|nr:glucokinase [Xanthomonadales bacterium]
MKNRRQLHLVADVGGTNVRFALAYARDAQPVPFEERTYAGADFVTLLVAIEHYLAEVGARPARAAIAVASPIDGDVVTMINRTWSFSRTELAHALGVQKLLVLNDFGAVAWAMP